jgi:hypothetical protein
MPFYSSHCLPLSSIFAIFNFFKQIQDTILEMANVPKASIELDDDYQLPSMADAAVADGVEDEKCILAQYRTTTEQKADFADLLNSCNREDIPIEWVIDIADESNGWFYGTAYGYNDFTNMLHVMVPDKENPTFDGEVQLDHRTMRLIECVDGASLALFNKIIRESVLKVKWRVEWYDEENHDGAGQESEEQGGGGAWMESTAKYYVRIINQLLVEDKDPRTKNDVRGLVILPADLNVRFLACVDGKGVEDFNTLVLEGIVSSSDEAWEAAQSGSNIPVEDPSPKEPPKETTKERDRSDRGDREREKERDRGDRDRDRERERESKDRSSSSSGGVSMRKLAEYARGVREAVVDIIEEREQRKTEEVDIANLFHSFVLDGDLDYGLQLMHHFGKIRNRDKNNLEEDEERVEIMLDDAKVNSAKLEKAILKVLKAGEERHAGEGDGEKPHKSKKESRR